MISVYGKKRPKKNMVERKEKYSENWLQLFTQSLNYDVYRYSSISITKSILEGKTESLTN